MAGGDGRLDDCDGVTGADGIITLTYGEPIGAELVVHADKDASPTAGHGTTSDTSPDPTQHGKVTKTDFNELDTVVPLVALPPRVRKDFE